MKKRNPKYWFNDEKETCELFGLKHSPGSGNGNTFKEDGYNDDIIMQSKATETGTISVKLYDLQQLIYHAEVDNKIPIFIGKYKPSNLMFVATFPQYLKYVSDYYSGAFTKTKSTLMDINIPKQRKKRKTVQSALKTYDELLEDEKEECEEIEVELMYMDKVKKKREERKRNNKWRK